LIPDKGWQRRLDDPIELPSGHQLVTLKDAGTYITKLPKAEHKAQEWQAAMEALILVATSGGPTMLARIGVIRALNRGHVREFNPDRKDPSLGPPKAEEGSVNGWLVLARDGSWRVDQVRPELAAILHEIERAIEAKLYYRNCRCAFGT
jgi:hypothetical protein